MLPPRKKPKKSGIERGPKLVWNRHRKFIRSRCCCVPGCDEGSIEVAHVRTAANSGTGIKPIDGYAVGLCHAHHMESHAIGDLTFQAKYRINLMKLAGEYVAASPDWQLRDTMRTLRDWEAA